MIYGITVYAAKCDNCGKELLEDEEYCGYNSKDFLIDLMGDSNWHSEDDKHYCPDCYSFDDNDNLILLKPKTQTP